MTVLSGASPPRSCPPWACPAQICPARGVSAPRLSSLGPPLAADFPEPLSPVSVWGSSPFYVLVPQPDLVPSLLSLTEISSGRLCWVRPHAQRPRHTSASLQGLTLRVGHTPQPGGRWPFTHLSRKGAQWPVWPPSRGLCSGSTTPRTLGSLVNISDRLWNQRVCTGSIPSRRRKLIWL